MWTNMYTGRKLMIEILVAEDDEMIANLIKINLVKAGYLCTCAYNGKDAANFLDSKHFDLCLFDIMLPEIDGYELLEYAKSMDIPSIFITAPVNSSCNLDVLAVFPQTPAAPIHPAQPAVCSH